MIGLVDKAELCFEVRPRIFSIVIFEGERLAPVEGGDDFGKGAGAVRGRLEGGGGGKI